jgi:hypothetical protein
LSADVAVQVLKLVLHSTLYFLKAKMTFGILEFPIMMLRWVLHRTAHPIHIQCVLSGLVLQQK